MRGLSSVEKTLAIIVALGVVGSLWAGQIRYRVERANRAVEIIVDGRDVATLSAAAGVTPTTAVAQLRAAGATALAAREVSLADLSARGDVAITPGGPGRLFLDFADARQAIQITGALKHKRRTLAIATDSPGLSGRSWSPDETPSRPAQVVAGQPVAARARVEVSGNLADLLDLGLVLDPEQLAAAQSAGLGLVARLANWPAADRDAITTSLRQARAAGARLVVFDRDQVLGYQGLIEHTAAEMQRLGLLYGAIELVPQYGADELGKKMAMDLVRVHSVPENEIPRLSPSVVQGRFRLGARERNIRACYARLFLRSADDALAYNCDYIAQLATDLREGGLVLGKASPLPATDTPRWLVLLMLLAVTAAAALLTGRLLPVGETGRQALAVILAAVFAGAYLGSGGQSLLIRQAVALLAGLTFPTLGLVLAWQALRARAETSPARARPVSAAIGWTVMIALCSLAGGLLVGGLLAHTRFLAGVELFRGVKLVLVGPALVLGLAVLGGLSRTITDPRVWRDQVVRSTRAFLGRPSLVAEVLLFLIAVGVLALLVIRSGNTPAGSAAESEQTARQWLSDALFARPRTKEFLLGYPALFLWLVAWLRARRRADARAWSLGRLGWVDALLVPAAIGQANIVDSFCHLHTPIVFSLVRSGHALWIGIVVGLLLTAVWSALRDHLGLDLREPREVKPTAPGASERR